MTVQEVLNDWDKWAYSTSLDERNNDLCAALAAIRLSIDPINIALEKILLAVQDYLPPDGISKDDLINRVISCVDPWPTDKSLKGPQ